MNEIAQLKNRLLAFLIDVLLVFSFYLFLIILVLSSSNIESLFSSLLFLLVAIFIIYPLLWIMFPIMLSKLGATPGKLLVGIRVVDSDNKFLSFKRSLFRAYIGYMVSGALFWLGFIWVFKDGKKRRAWHDMMVSSVVVVKNKALFPLGLVIFVALLLFNAFLLVLSFGQYVKNKDFYASLVGDVSKIRLDHNALKNLDFNNRGLDNSLKNLDFDGELDIADLLESQQSMERTLEGFKNYKNLGEGIKMQYPSTWTAQEGTMGTVVMFLSPLENQEDIFQENISLIVQDLSAQPLTLKQYTDLSLAQIKQIITDLKIQSGPNPIALGGELGNTLVYSGRQGKLDLKWKQVWMIKNNKAYLITYSAPADNFDIYLRKVENVIFSLDIL